MKNGRVVGIKVDANGNLWSEIDGVLYRRVAAK